jgi:hypothetical protein
MVELNTCGIKMVENKITRKNDTESNQFYFNKPLISLNFNRASTGVSRLISIAESKERISSKV